MKKDLIDLTILLKCYLINPQENDLYCKAKQMGVTDSTAKDYIRTVIIQAQKIIFHINFM